LSDQENEGQDWREEEEERRKRVKVIPAGKETKLSLKDWLALFIAALESVLLPFLLLAGALFILVIIVAIFF
jgi:hypothetical protein